MQYFIGVANRHGAVMFFEMTVFMQFLSNVWKSECEVAPALGDPVFLQVVKMAFLVRQCRGLLLFPDVSLLGREKSLLSQLWQYSIIEGVI